MKDGIQRTDQSLGNVIDVWYIYYSVLDYSFSVKAAMVDADNPLDSVAGNVTCYYLNNSTWQQREVHNIDMKTNVKKWNYRYMVFYKMGG